MAIRPRRNDPVAFITKVPQGKVDWGSLVVTHVPTKYLARAPMKPPHPISMHCIKFSICQILKTKNGPHNVKPRGSVVGTISLRAVSSGKACGGVHRQINIELDDTFHEGFCSTVGNKIPIKMRPHGQAIDWYKNSIACSGSFLLDLTLYT